MNERIQEIISLLLENPEIKITEMMQKLSLTRRQINYAIGLINDGLKTRKLPNITRHSDGSFTFSDEIKELLVNDQRMSNSFPNKNRAALILLYLIVNVNYVSLADLTIFIQYSKTTILRDIRYAGKVATGYGLILQYNRVQGYFLKGSETQIFKLATNLVLKNSDILVSYSAKYSVFSKKIVAQAVNLITDFEQRFQVSFSDRYFNNLKILIQIILTRGFAGESSRTPDKFIEQTKEFQYLRNDFKLANLNNFYVEWIALEILSANIFDKNNSEYSPDEVELFGFVHQLVEGFKTKTLVNIEDQSRFEKRLLNHLRPACFRVKYGLPNIEILSLDEDEDQRLLNKIIRDLIHPLEEWLGTKFSLNEVRLLTYYFGYLLVDNTKSKNSNKAKYEAVVVCSNGIIMSNILIEVLRNIFPEITFLGTMSAREFAESDREFSIVFSNIPLKTTLPNYIVKPNMTYSEKTTLRYRVLKDLGLEKVDYQVNALLDLISKHVKIGNNAQLRNEIVNILLSDSKSAVKEHNQNKELPDLLTYIKVKYIKVIDDKDTDWKDTLYQALEPLIADKKVESKYYLELVKQISSRYNYSFLGETMAIPHGVPATGIKDDGISILISHFPIKLPYGKKVRIIAPIAFFHMDRYLKAINQLATLATDEKQIRKLLNTRTSDQAYQIIKNYVEEGN